MSERAASQPAPEAALPADIDAMQELLARGDYVADRSLATYAGTGSWEEVYASWRSSEGQYYWRDLDLEVVPLDTSYYERRDRMAFEMAVYRMSLKVIFI